MSLDKECVGGGNEEAARFQISYCNFRYVYYTHSGILMHSELFAERILIQEARASAVTRKRMNASVPLWKISHFFLKKKEEFGKGEKRYGVGCCVAKAGGGKEKKSRESLNAVICD